MDISLLIVLMMWHFVEVLILRQLEANTHKTMVRRKSKFTPNPVQDELYITTTTIEPVTATLLDVTGRIVLEQTFTANTQLSTSNLPNGAYFCEIWKGNQKIKTEKLSIIH